MTLRLNNLGNLLDDNVYITIIKACVYIMGLALALFVLAVLVPLIRIIVKMVEGSQGSLVRSVLFTSYGQTIRVTFIANAFMILCVVVEAFIICFSTVVHTDIVAIATNAT